VAIVDQGETYSSPTIEVRDSTGVLQNAGTVSVVVTLPDGTTANPTVTTLGTGQYVFDHLTTVPELYGWEATATGGILGTAVRKWSGSFYVVGPGRLLVDTADALDHLRVTLTAAADRERLRLLCLRATDAVERDLDRAITRRTVTAELHDGGKTTVALLRTPVISVSAVSVDGTPVTGGAGVDWTLRASAGLLVRGSGKSWAVWPDGVQNVSVTYVAGMTSPPVVARGVALNIVARTWQSSQQMPHPAIDGSFGGFGAGSSETVALWAALGQLSPVELDAYNSLRLPGIG
jgi:hypothetical protein